jgi:hypothetical protein
MVAPSRRNGGYCPSWRPQQIDELVAFSDTRDLRHAMLGPRGLVNLGAYSRHGSVEFRSHGGTTNYAKLSAWVRFLFAALESESDAVYDSPEEWLTVLGLQQEDYAALMRFELAAERAARAVETADQRSVREVTL